MKILLSELRQAIKEALLEQKNDYERDISKKIVQLRTQLKKRDVVSKVELKLPNLRKKTSNYGQIEVCVDKKYGKGSRISPARIDKLILKVMKDVGLQRYFEMSGSSHSGSHDVCFMMKDKYVKYFLPEPQKEEPKEEEFVFPSERMWT